MSEEIKLAKSNKDSGRMTDSALRQKFDERNQLHKHCIEDLLCDFNTDVMRQVGTVEQQHTRIIVSETNAPTKPPEYDVSVFQAGRKSLQETAPAHLTLVSVDFGVNQAQIREVQNNVFFHKEESGFHGIDAQVDHTPHELCGSGQSKAAEAECEIIQPEQTKNEGNRDAVFPENHHNVYDLTPFDSVETVAPGYQPPKADQQRQEDDPRASGRVVSTLHDKNGLYQVSAQNHKPNALTFPIGPFVPIAPNSIPEQMWTNTDRTEKVDCASPWRENRRNTFPERKQEHTVRHTNVSNRKGAPGICSGETCRGQRSRQLELQSPETLVNLAQKSKEKRLIEDPVQRSEVIHSPAVGVHEATQMETASDSACITPLQEYNSIEEVPQKNSAHVAKGTVDSLIKRRSEQTRETSADLLVKLVSRSDSVREILQRPKEQEELVRSVATHLDEVAQTETASACVTQLQEHNAIEDLSQKNSARVARGDSATSPQGSHLERTGGDNSDRLMARFSKSDPSEAPPKELFEQGETVQSVEIHLDEAAMTEEEIEAAFIAQVKQKDVLPTKREVETTARSEKEAVPFSNLRLKKARKKSKIDRMLNNTTGHVVNPDVLLNQPEELSAHVLPGTDGKAISARTSISSVSRFLRRSGKGLLKTGINATTSAALNAQVAEKLEDSDADAYQVIQQYKKAAKGTHSLSRTVLHMKRRPAEKRAAQVGRSAGRATTGTAGKAVKQGGQKLVTVAAETIKETVTSITALVGSTVVPVFIVILAILLVVVIFMSLFVSIAGSPYGIFFVHEQQQEIEFDTAINRITNSYYNKIYDKEMSQDYDTIGVSCAIIDSEAIWKEIIAVYAVDVCKEGMDAMTMDEKHYEILKEVFWQKVSVRFRESSWTERVETVVKEAYSHEVTVTNPVTGEVTVTSVTVPAEVEVTYVVHRTLSVTVITKTLDQLKIHYRFTDGEKNTVDDLLAESEELWSALTPDFTNLVLSSGESGTVGAIDVTAYTTVAETVYRGLIAYGYSQQAACGVLGNIQQESSFNPNAGSNYYGLCQWGGGRLANLKRLSGWDTASVQTGFILRELSSQTEIWSQYGSEVNHRYNGVKITSLSAFQHCTNVKAAAGAFCVCYERSGELPGNRWYEARLTYAQQWYTYAQSHWNN